MTEAVAEAPPLAIAPAAASAPALLQVDKLCKSFGGGAVQVFDQISFSVPAGQRLALIGANGAGKSTLLRCLLRLIEPDAGRIHCGGTEFTGLHGRALRRARSRIGFIFQKHHLVPQLSVLSNVIHGMLGRRPTPRGYLQAMAPADERQRAMHCLQQVGLAELARRPVAQLSGGQTQRVAIARALMQEPLALFADEAAASLDPRAGEEVMQLFCRLNEEQGVTLVFVSHDLQHALHYGQRIIGLAEGQIALDRPAAELQVESLQGLYA